MQVEADKTNSEIKEIPIAQETEEKQPENPEQEKEVKPQEEVAEEQKDENSDGMTDNKDGPPNLEKALQKRLNASPNKIDKHGKRVYMPCWSSKLQDFANLGVGIFLYFRFLKQTAILFIFLSILAAPLIYSAVVAQFCNVSNFIH